MNDYHGDLSRAYALQQAGSLSEAEVIYRDFLRQQPDNTVALEGLGKLAIQAGQAQSAIDCFQRALQKDKKNPQLLLELSKAFHMTGDWKSAAQMSRKSLKLQTTAMGLFILADSYMRQDKPDEAMKYYKQALAQDNTLVEVRLGLSIAYRKLKLHEDAIRELKILLDMQPTHAGGWNNLGNVYRDLQQWDDAIECYRRALDLNINVIDTWLNLGVVYEQSANNPAALEVYEHVMRQRKDGWPDLTTAAPVRDITSAQFRKACVNYLALLLRMGDFARGLDWFDYRLTEADQAIHIRRLSMPLWRGEALQGKRLLLMREQGLGDEICYASLLPDVLAQAQQCVIECQSKLYPLFRRSFPQAQVISVDLQRSDWQDIWRSQVDTDPDYAVQIPGIMKYTRRCVEDFQPRAYLQADPEKIRYWQDQLKSISAAGPCVGISWRGGRANTHGNLRSMELEQMAIALHQQGMTLVNLQYSDTGKERERLVKRHGIQVYHWQQAIDDYDHTAALVATLDGVVSVDTSLAHLAGALGQDVRCLVPGFADWRWQLERQDTLWYPRMTLYRRSQGMDWDDLMAGLARELAACLLAD